MFLFGANISKNTYFCTRLSGLHEYKTTNMLLFLDIGGGELLLIIIAGMLLFGRDKMPGIIRSVAKGTDYIKKASEEVKQQINAETGLDEVLDDVRRDVRAAAEEVKDDLADIASQTGQTVSSAVPPETDADASPSPEPEPAKPTSNHVANP